MQLFYFIHKGKRERQEDALFISDDQKLYIVCDGVGGKPGGQIASKFIGETILKYYLSNISNFNFIDIDIPIRQAVKQLSILEFEKPSLNGLATTMIAFYIQDNHCYFAHIGDSKGYFISQNRFKYITRDHSLVQELFDSGFLNSQNKMKEHPLKSYLTKVISSRFSDFDRIVIKSFQIPQNSFILIGSDGAFEGYTDNSILCHFSREDLSVAERWESFKERSFKTSSDNSTAVLLFKN